MSSLASMRRDVLRKIRQVGVAETIKHGFRKIARDLTTKGSRQAGPVADEFDRKYGTDTAAMISVGALDIPDEKLAHSNRYEAVVPAAFVAMMGHVPIDHAEYVFVDIGSGKGRALLMASQYPFQRIIGVEISPALAAIAQRNIAIYKDENQRCRSLSTVAIDGLDYEPPSTNCILYLNNPFDAKIMAPFVANVERSLMRNRQRIYVVYHPPMHRALWDASKMFELCHVAPQYVIYRSR